MYYGREHVKFDSFKIQIQLYVAWDKNAPKLLTVPTYIYR